MSVDDRSHRSSQAGESKEGLQRRMEETRESISATVSEIKETVGDQVESVKRTLGNVAEWREQFAKEPLVWSLGTLAAGFAMGYTLGYAHKNAKARKNRSEIAAFADAVVEELSGVGNTLVMPRLNKNIGDLFGVDFSDLLKTMKTSGGRRPTKGRGGRMRTVRSVAGQDSRARTRKALPRASGAAASESAELDGSTRSRMKTARKARTVRRGKARARK